MQTALQRNFWLGNFKAILSLSFLLLLTPVIIFAATQVVKFFPWAAPLPADITIDAGRSQAQLPRPWQGLSQGGELENDGTLVSLAPLTAQIKSLNISYVRLDHVLDRPYKSRIQDILASGAIPFISLSYFPSDVADSDTGPVKNYVLWQAKVKALVEDISGRNNLNIAGVYYEVWNEPDGPTFGNFSPSDYLVLYQKTVEAVLSAQNVNAFKVGGPALADLRRCTNGLLFVCQEYFLDNFLKNVAVSHTRLDFISWHKYSYQISDFQNDVNFILATFNKYPSLPTAEKIITEWGSDPTKSSVHATVLDAAHLVAAARAFTGHVNLATKFEVRDNPAADDSGWGIMFYNGDPKPAFQALKLLGLLRPGRLLLSGEGTLVTGLASGDRSGVTAIIVDYDPAGSYSALVPVKVVNLTPGHYRLTKYTISNIYPQSKKETVDLNLSTGSYQTTQTMTANSVVVYDWQLLSQ